MNKKTTITIIIGLIILILFGLYACSDRTTVVDSSTPKTTVKYTSGGGSASAPVTESTGFSFFDFSTWKAPRVTLSSTDERLTPILECTRDSACNKCANPDYDKCVDNKCVCAAPVVDADIRITSTPECSRDTDCNKCANPTYDKCVSGSCSCVAPVTPLCTDTDKGILRYTDGLNYKTQGEVSDTKGNYGIDMCLNGLLYENYCDENNERAAKAVDCEFVYGRGYFCVEAHGICGILV